MQLTIIPKDKAVYKDGLCYLNLSWEGTPSDIHALQWKDVSGWIEYNTDQPNLIINSLPEWAINAVQAWDIANIPAPVAPPSAEDNKQTASNLLYSTDWATIPDVSDPLKSNPYLTNAQEFVNYRNTIRQYVVYPVAGNIDWAEVPKAIWSTQ